MVLKFQKWYTTEATEFNICQYVLMKITNISLKLTQMCFIKQINNLNVRGDILLNAVSIIHTNYND